MHILIKIYFTISKDEDKTVAVFQSLMLLLTSRVRNKTKYKVFNKNVIKSHSVVF